MDEIRILKSRVQQLEAYNRRLIQLLEKNLINVPDEIAFDDMKRMGKETYYDLYYKLDAIESELKFFHLCKANFLTVEEIMKKRGK